MSDFKYGRETFAVWSRRIGLELLPLDPPKVFGGWSRIVVVRSTGKFYRVGVERGAPALGMYGKRGFHWRGWVRDQETGQSLLNRRVPKNAGARGLIAEAWLAHEEAISIPELVDVEKPNR